MTTKTHLARASRVAIAAALMLGTAPAVAQMSAAPEAAIPPAAVAPVPQPTITVPDVAPPATQPPAAATPPMESVPVVQAIPPSEPEPAAPQSATEEEPSPATRPAASRVTAPAETTPAEATLEATVAPSPDASAVVPDFTSSTVPPVSEPVAQDSVSVAGEEDSTGQIAVALLAALILALGAGAFLAFGRRRKRQTASVPVVERPPLAQARIVPEVQAEPVRTAAPEPVSREPIRNVEPVTFVSSTPVTGGLPHAGASVALPRTVPESFEERDALLKRMIAATPDRANPFRSRRARAKRAKLILQSLGQRFTDGKSRIDLSQYPNNWPELAHHKSAAA